jgi:hypothetical protein
MLSLLRIAEGRLCGLTAPKGGPSRRADFPEMDILFGRGYLRLRTTPRTRGSAGWGRGPAQARDRKTCKPDLVTYIAAASKIAGLVAPAGACSGLGEVPWVSG